MTVDREWAEKLFRDLDGAGLIAWPSPQMEELGQDRSTVRERAIKIIEGRLVWGMKRQIQKD